MTLRMEMQTHGQTSLKVPTNVNGAELEKLVGLQADDKLLLRKYIAGKPVVSRVNRDEAYDLNQWDDVLVVTCLAVIQKFDEIGVRP